MQNRPCADEQDAKTAPYNVESSSNVRSGNERHDSTGDRTVAVEDDHVAWVTGDELKMKKVEFE